MERSNSMSEPMYAFGHLVVVEGFSDGEVMGRELERCADDLSGVRGEHVLEDGGERASGALLVAVEGEQHLLLVRGDEAVEGGLELGREEAADPSKSALVGEEGDDELGGAHLEVLKGILLGGLNSGAGDDAAAASGNGAALSMDGGRGRRSGSNPISSCQADNRTRGGSRGRAASLTCWRESADARGSAPRETADALASAAIAGRARFDACGLRRDED